MILSILIPVYNYTCVALVSALQQQAADCNIEFEILVADDGSDGMKCVAENRIINNIPHSVYHEMDVNRGRSWIRNWLVQHSHGQYLLFIDSDALVCSEHFISDYLSKVSDNVVICGGILHPEAEPSPSARLRFRYEKMMEPAFTAERRNEHPYANLRTFNFLMPRQVALSHPFDESITLYGYEDTLLGSQFESDGVQVIHIDNPLINGDLESNERFLAKTEQSMVSLFQLRKKMQNHSRLLKHFSRLRRFKLDAVIRLAFPLLRPLFVRHLTGSNPSVFIFQLYKLAYYSTLFKSE